MHTAVLSATTGSSVTQQYSVLKQGTIWQTTTHTRAAIDSWGRLRQLPKQQDVHVCAVHISLHISLQIVP